MRDMFRMLKLGAALVGGGLVALGAGQVRAAEPSPAKSAPAAKPAPAKADPAAAKPARVVELSITEKGYEPSPVTLKKGEPVTLKLTRKTDRTCATEILIDGTDINVPLPLGKTVEVPFTPEKSGKLKYGCAMGKMISGVFLVE